MSDSESGGSKAALPLEQQGREELLQHCKRQLLLLQRTKAKLDEEEEHRKDREKVESELRIQIEEISKERDELNTKHEHDSARKAQRIQELETRNNSLESEIAELRKSSPENKCLTNELSEATNELNLLREEKRELLEKLDTLESARDAALELEKRMAQALDENQSLRAQLKDATEQLESSLNQKTSTEDASSQMSSGFSEPSEQINHLTNELKELLEKLAQAEQQLKQMEDEKVEWQAKETRTRCRIEELESNVQVLTADLNNDRQHICTLTEALEKAEGEETNAKNSLQKLQSRVDDLISSLAVSCGIIFASSDQQIERFSRFCLDTLLALVELSPPAPALFDRLSTGLKAISDDFVRCDHRRVQAEQKAKELSQRLDGALDEVEACKVKVDSARSALENEKKLREDVERRSLETAEECDILRSTITALTNQLEEAQVHLSQLLMAREAEENGREANSTDDDKNSCDDARTEQIATFRERINALEADLAKERALHETAQRTNESAAEELIKMKNAVVETTKKLDDVTNSKTGEIQKLTKELETAQNRVNALDEEVSKAQALAKDFEDKLNEKSSLVEKLHDTLDELVERANSGISTQFEGSSVLSQLLRCLGDLVGDFSKKEDVEKRLSNIILSDSADEKCVQSMVQQLVDSVKSFEAQNRQVELSVEQETAAVQLVTSTQNLASEHAEVDNLIKLKEDEIRERDEKIVKLKNLLVKMKRELVAAKATQQQQQAPNILANNIQSLQTEYDKAVDELEAEKKLNRELQKKVTQTVDQVAEMELKSSQLEDDKRQLLVKVEQAEQSVKEAVHAKAEAEAQVLVVSNELEKARAEMDRLRQELSQQIQNVTALQVETSALQQQVELGRSAIDEAQQMDERSRQLEQEAKIARDQVEQLITAKTELEVRLAEAEKNSSDMERLRDRCEQLDETKDSLTRELDRGQHRIEELEAKIRELEGQLASEKQMLKEAELQVAAKVLEIQQLQASLQSQRDSQSRLVRTLEGRAASLKRDYSTVKLELDETKKEFEAYKIKAHSMIKIKEKPEKKKELVDDNIISSLKLKIDEMSQELSVSKTEVEAAHEQLSRLQDRYDSLQKDFAQKNQDFKKRLANSLDEREKEIRAEMVAQETMKLEEAAARHRDEMNRKEQAQKTMVEILEDKLVELRAELDAVKEANRTRDIIDRSPDMHNASSNDVFLEPVRQPAEGSESTDAIGSMRTLPFDVIPTSGFQPLDKLLEHQEVPSFETFESVTSRLEEAMKRIDHFTELLNDSEVNNLRLSEQVRVLKEEVRRLERNKERDDEFGNLEYLKNVVLKYLTMKSERERLVPVLVTILKLSPDEKRTLQQGEQGWGLLPKFL